MVIIISEEIFSYFNSLVVKYEENLQKQLSDNVVLPPQTFQHYLRSPLNRFNIKVICPVHGLFLKNGTWTISSNKIAPEIFIKYTEELILYYLCNNSIFALKIIFTEQHVNL